MAWNEPGSGKQRDRDPWQGNSGGGGGPSPDLDALIRKLRQLLGRLTGGGGSDNKGGDSGGGSPSSPRSAILLAMVGVLIAWVLIDSWVLVDAREAGVVLRFGKLSRTMTPGFNLKFPRPIESVNKVDATQVRAASDHVRVLTADENIVMVEFNVQYQVANATEYLFSVRDPDDTLRHATESAVREVTGANLLDAIMPDQVVDEDGLAVIGAVNTSANLVIDAKRVLQQTLDRYNSGLMVTEMNFQNVRPPADVKEAFDDAISAREDRQRRSNEADAYAKRVVPEARGDAARILAEANGYRVERMERAEGDAARFELIEHQYRLAPGVTRKRLYLETMQGLIAKTPKVIDMSGGKNLLYLPIHGEAQPANVTNPAAGALIERPAMNEGAR